MKLSLRHIQLLVALPGLIAVLLGNHYPSWLNVGFVALALVAGLIALLPLRSSPGGILGAGIARLLIVLLGLATAILPLLLIIQARAGDELALILMIATALLWPWLLVRLVVNSSEAMKSQVGGLAAAVQVLVISSIVCVVLLEGGLQLILDRLPITIVQRMPQIVTRYYDLQLDTPHGAIEFSPNEEVAYTINGADGDLYYKSCLRPTPSTLFEPYTVEFVRDDHGFRNSTPWPDQVDLVVVGDSFTAGERISMPYWTNITPSVLVLGAGATGTIDHRIYLEQFGSAMSPEVVVEAYFGGNDLTDNWDTFHSNGSSVQKFQDQLNNRAPRDYLVLFNLISYLKDNLIPESCGWPVEDAQGNQLAFLDEYLSISTLDTATLRDSEFFAVTRNEILQMADEVEALDATFVLVYIPHKLQAYWEQLLAAGQIETISQYVSPLTLGLEGGLTAADAMSPAAIADVLSENIDSQQLLLSELADEAGFLFLDLTPSMRRAVAEGESLFFYGDSHWNQVGNDLAGEILREFLAEHNLLDLDAE